jgi:hypothetical protein
MSNEIDTARKIVDVVAEGVNAVTPLIAGAAPEVAPFVPLALGGVRALLSFADQLGHGDAVRASLDAELAAARAATDDALERKHGGR